MLKGVPLAPNFPMQILAEYLRGKSGSDLKEFCQNAVMLPVCGLVHQARGDIALLACSQDKVRICLLSVDLFNNTFTQGLELRPLTIEDFNDPEGTSIAMHTQLAATISSIEPLD